MTRLGNYLDNIAKGKPINFRLFLASVPDVYRSQPSRYFTSRKVGKGHIVTVIDEVVWADLKRQAVSPEDRIEAAILGDSHRARLDETFVLAFHALCPGKIPDVVYLSQQHSNLQRFKNQRTLLLLENEKNFFGYPAMFSAMEVMMSVSFSLNDTDVAFAQGKKCTSELVMNWLDQYDAIYFAADLDLGGLTMFESLSNRLGDKVRLVQPEQLDVYEALFQRVPEKDKDFMQAVAKARSLGFDALAETLKKCRKFMEQEALLSLDPVKASDSLEDCSQ